MSRIDVCPADQKGTFKVMVNFEQRGTKYHSAVLANKEATLVHVKMQNTELHLITIK